MKAEETQSGGDALQVGEGGGVQLTSGGDVKSAIISAEEIAARRRWASELDKIQREIETMASRVKALKSEITSQVR